jgi:putative flippase GtrA
MRHLFGYGLIGISCLFIEITVFSILSSYDINVYVLNTIIVGTLIFLSFNLNAFYNFKKFDNYKNRMIKFLFINISGLLISNISLGIALEYFAVNSAKLLSVVPVVVMQFLFNKFWTFK